MFITEGNEEEKKELGALDADQTFQFFANNNDTEYFSPDLAKSFFKDMMPVYDYVEKTCFAPGRYVNQCYAPFDPGAVWSLIKQAVKDRANAITIWYDVPCTQLIADPDAGIVHGHVARVGEDDLSIRARNGVVLACAMEMSWLRFAATGDQPTTCNL